eukprot:2583781-Amphidinium_carterae.2
MDTPQPMDADKDFNYKVAIPTEPAWIDNVEQVAMAHSKAKQMWIDPIEAEKKRRREEAV